jgi:hypothetical protein
MTKLLGQNTIQLPALISIVGTGKNFATHNDRRNW